MANLLTLRFILSHIRLILKLSDDIKDVRFTDNFSGFHSDISGQRIKALYGESCVGTVNFVKTT